jgi:class 3 adenylate cyclase
MVAEWMRESCSQEVWWKSQAEFETRDISSLLRDIRCPTLLIHNRDNRFNLIRGGQRLAAGIPSARLTLVEDTTYASVPAMIAEFLGGPAARVTRRRTESPTGTAVILFADIADSTGLTERLGDAAFREKARELDGALRTVIRNHSGTAIEGKLLGDGVLAVFTSARQAVQAAQQCARTGDTGGLPLHLGLHAGDVIRDDNNVYGGAVNIAARISGLSAPGEVLVSETVRSLARTSAGVRFEDRGEQALKGVGEPVRVWVVREASDG